MDQYAGDKFKKEEYVPKQVKIEVKVYDEDESEEQEEIHQANQAHPNTQIENPVETQIETQEV